MPKLHGRFFKNMNNVFSYKNPYTLIKLKQE